MSVDDDRPYVSPDLSAAALLPIDTEGDFLDGEPAEIPDTSQALPQMQALVKSFRAFRPSSQTRVRS